jgi:hypothetical protein
MTSSFVRPDPLQAAATAAAVQMKQLESDYMASPQGQAEHAKASLLRITNDPNRQDEARALEQTITRAEAEALTAPIAMSDAARLDQALSGVVERGPELTWGSQVPSRDLTTAVQDSLERGVRESMIRAFYEHGHGDDPAGRAAEIAAADAWERKLMDDPEMQRRLFAKDPEIMRQFDYFAMFKQRQGEEAVTE